MVAEFRFAPVEQQVLEPELWLPEDDGDFDAEALMLGMSCPFSSWGFNFEPSPVFTGEKGSLPETFGELNSGKLV